MKLQEHQLVPYQAVTLPLDRGPWLVVAPHADDESFGMGGTLARAAQTGIETHLAVMTDGALGGAENDLVAQREREAREAAQVLGMQSVRFYHQPDRQLSPQAALAQRLLDDVRVLKPAAVFFPGAFELHPDHRASALLVWQVMQRLGSEAPLAVSYEISTQSPANCLVDISATMSRKQQALNVYQSQLGQNNYVEIVMALNKLRTFTLPQSVRWAEAFYCFSKEELREDLAGWATTKIAGMLAGTKGSA